MATIEYSVAGQQIVVTKDEKLVENTIGIYTVGFTFDAASWGDFTQKTAVFVHEDYPDTPPYEVPIDDGEAPIPAAVLKYGNIMIGVYGSTQTQQYPTIWAPAKRVWPGAGPGVEPPEDPVFGMVVRTAPQELTEEQQEIARTNIGAAPAVVPDSTPGNITVIGSNQNIIDGGFKATEAFPVESASGAVASFSDGADGVPVKSMTVQIEPNQKATFNDVSPTNICLINGWTSFNVNCGKKNLWGGAKLKEQLLTYVPSGVYDDENHTFDFSAAASVVYNQKAGRIGFFWIPWKENTRYTFILTLKKTANAGLNLNAVYTDGTSVAIPGAATPGTKQTFVYTTPANKTLFYIGKRNSGGHTILHLDECGVFEGVLTADDFVPYNGNTYTITFPTEAGTVYGGELTVAEDGSGTLTVDKAFAEFNGTENWTKPATYNGTSYKHTFFAVSLTRNTSKGTTAGLITNWAETKQVSDSEEYNFWTTRFGSGVNTLYVLTPSDTMDTITLDSFKTMLSDTHLQVVRYVTPTTYTLTAPQVSTLLGLNNIWADTGNIEVTYHADPNIFVDEKTRATKESIAHVEDGYTASQPYAVGESLYVNNTLYEVISAIASGGTITVGTNVQEAPVANQLSALKDWESATVTRNTTYLSVGATYCLVNRKLKLAILFGWFTVSTVPSSGATLLTISGIKAYNNYVYTYAHKGESVISLRSNTSSGNLTLSTDSETSANVTIGAYALQTVIIPIL